MVKVTGKVIPGKQKGRELGFPTANIELKKRIDSGVYAGVAYFNDKVYKAAIFINPSGLLLEFHLPDFVGHLYGKEIEVAISKKIREVQKFESDKELTNQIKEDIELINNMSKL